MLDPMECQQLGETNTTTEKIENVDDRDVFSFMQRMISELEVTTR